MELSQSISLPTNPSGDSHGGSDSDLVLAGRLAALDLKEAEAKSEEEGGTAHEKELGGGEAIGSDSGDESDRDRGEAKKEEDEEEDKESIWMDFGGEEIGDQSDSSDNSSDLVRVKIESDEGVKEIEVGDEPAKKEGKFSTRTFHYPLRLDAEDCSFFLKTGMCKFGSNCKFNHPFGKRINHQASRGRIKGKEKEKEKEKEKVKEREKENERDKKERNHPLDCKFYARTGGCKYGETCKYYHRRKPTRPAPDSELNFLGLPIRAGESECSFYMRTGSCKYGVHCRFNHPDPTDAAGADTSAGYSNGVPGSLNGGSNSNIPPSWASPRSMNEAAPAPYVPMMAPPTQGAPPNSEWNGYQAPVYVPPERNIPAPVYVPPERNIPAPVYVPPERNTPPPPAYIMNNLSTETNIYNHYSSQNQVDNYPDYPERPGEPECNHYVRTGTCRFRSNCKYHHPKKNVSMETPFTLSDKGLPLRPDQTICSHYSMYGICKYGPACKYDHSEVNESEITIQP